VIHPSAIVHPGAKLGRGVEVGPFCVVGENVTLESRAKLLAHVVINGHTTIGEDSVVYPFASLGAPSQDRKAVEGELAYTTIGARCVIREGVTIHRGTAEAGGITSVGDDCLLLAYTHVAHNCQVGNHVTMSNMAQLAGHVVVEDHALVGAMAGVHQFVRIGRYAFVGGYTKLVSDLPPFLLCDGNPAKVYGLNAVGLRRAGFTREALAELKDAYKTLYRSELNVSQAVTVLRERVQSDEGRTLLAFLDASSERGILK
jgi:UDP-N-acetylglucosamine acyltransferase